MEVGLERVPGHDGHELFPIELGALTLEMDYMCVQVYLCTCACGSQGPMADAILNHAPFKCFLLRQSVSLNSELADSASLASQQGTGVLLPP